MALEYAPRLCSYELPISAPCLTRARTVTAKALQATSNPLRSDTNHTYRGPGGRCVSRYRVMCIRKCSDVPSPSLIPWSRLGYVI